MKIKKRSIFMLVAVFSLMILVFIGFNWLRNVTDQFQSFSVTIKNKSDYDIVLIETGIIKGASNDIYTKKIMSGETRKINPLLNLKGEGAIYIKYTDSRGATKEETVCGYTEYLSGNSKVTISNDKVTIEQNCM
ncbi:hypothetical protein GCM10008018_24260 [Paenibacillus marchantiophytorum]|uniref:Uncharacterized protein n=1 Tax=Paenibacillus marchantiophytorum TaxID=1619310 RepID=A0ABQ1EMB1_9BACL|nr:hypothetical protein [Paenibacillus marchantiophytorum]GFZ77765.1 hypothetical protein GCM10008018_24260 [Paenibacillus marchantiophytorum]